MRKPPPHPLSRRSDGFTLLELLVVIGIIGILASLMYPATTGVLRNAKKAHAENTCYNLKNAISAYFTEYRKYPAKSGDNETDEIRTDNKLMDILLGADNADGKELNPRRIAFYTGKAAKPAGNGKYRKGIVLEADGGGELWDPFAELYYVRMDLDYNSRTEKPSWDNTTDSQYLPESILVWSTGEDLSVDVDNIKTW
ncbi:MAG: type II secretion system protein [Verrucomicrobiales bacterium]